MKPHPYLTNITETCWPINYTKRRITIRQRQKHISQVKLLEKLTKRFIKKGYDFDSLQKVGVQVSMYTVGWILKNRKNFLEFSRVLKECKNPQIYQTEFIHALVDEFWESNQETLFKWFFYPWLSYMLSSFYFFCTVAAEGIWIDDDDVSTVTYKYSLTALTLALFCY